ncbi:uncharacterized protein LOC122039742 [Zingiber officinale]|uniref:uncharacterized protein LOC122039742 n=1 Tax=Zingiber officinale TaxID=94328 RepID=UPI001C4CF72E|nr:uncharacterized protein LOC122039742 [Zingiber officinale]
MTDHLLDPDAFARLMITPLHRRDHASAPEDRLTSLHNDLLISILSFLPIKQRVALSAVCSRFLRLLPSIPRLDAFRLEVVHPSGGVDISQHFTFPRALIPDPPMPHRLPQVHLFIRTPRTAPRRGPRRGGRPRSHPRNRR